jgi:hypothetical protein
LPSTTLVRAAIVPVTWQCAGTGVPAIVNVPAGTGTADASFVPAYEARLASSAHASNAPPVAGASEGGVAGASVAHEAVKASAAIKGKDVGVWRFIGSILVI